MKSIPCDWAAVAALAASGVTLQELSRRFGVKLDTIKSRSRRGGWKTAARDVQAGKESAAVAAGQMHPRAGDGKAIVVSTLVELGSKTKLNLAQAASKAAEHAAGLDGATALSRARNIKEVAATGSTIHGWSQPGGDGNPIININLLGRVIPDLPAEIPALDTPVDI